MMYISADAIQSYLLYLLSFTRLCSGDVSLIAVRITFSMIGKFGITGAICVIYLYTPEIYPTTLRSRRLCEFMSTLFRLW